MMTDTSSSQTITLDTRIPDKIPKSLVSDEASLILQWCLYSGLCQLISVFGIGTNIANIVCFVKQGFKDPVNVSLMGLAVSDLISLVTIVWTNICINPDFSALDLPFDATEFQYLTGGMPHSTFTRVSAWITALITSERCFCVSAPLKAKSVVTTKRVSVIVVCIFIILPAVGAPTYVVNSLGWKFFPGRNKTLIGVVSAANRDEVETISYLINNFFISFGSFLIVVVTATILAVKLGKKSEFLKTSTNIAQSDKLSNRNQKVAKMVLMISTLFIVCFVPVSFIFLGMSLEPSFSLGGQQHNLLLLCGGVGLALESFNSSVNIFFYFSMSTKYRETFSKIFRVVFKNKET